MAFDRYSLALAARLLIAALALVATVFLWRSPGYHGATLVAALVFATAGTDLWRLITRSNRELARFLNAVRHSDYAQRFDFSRSDSGFPELGEAITEIVSRMRLRAADQTIELRRLSALIDHIPVPLLTIASDGGIALQNNAARRLFGAAHVTRLPDLRQFGDGFHDAVAGAVPGARELVRFNIEGVEYRLTLATSEIAIAGGSERLISLQDIQSELDSTQTEAWQDLVRVLTHEIMNSITPVTSLAATAVDLAQDIREQTRDDAALAAQAEDLHHAVSTVARRADSLMNFVDRYRQMTRMAPPNRKRVVIAELFDAVCELAATDWPPGRVSLHTSVTPSGLDVYADRDLLEPVLLNLLRNAWQATQSLDQVRIDLRGRLNRRGNVVIEVSDNGPGVPHDLAHKVFVPFFTTKEGGSGVGLALARQVMIAHGGFIRVGDAEGGGAIFSLTF